MIYLHLNKQTKIFTVTEIEELENCKVVETFETTDEAVNWLKSLKDNMTIQQFVKLKI